MIKKKTESKKLSKTAQKILAAARAVFAEKGYSGTHVDEIAKRAGVNKASLYYQIGDKDTLYANVLHQVIGNTASALTEAVAGVDSPEEKLGVYINGIVTVVDNNPEMPSIMMREMAGSGTHLPRLVIEDMVAVIGILLGILDQGKKKGAFIDVAPFLIHMMIIGTVLFYKRGAPIKDKQEWLPSAIKARDKKLKGSLGDEVTKLVLKAIRAT